eukprot:4260381-Heterocapsa_arctica.AAC.1
MSEVKHRAAYCSPAAGARLLDSVYAAWASTAEAELLGITGCDIRLGHRAKKPVLVRKYLGTRAPAFNGMPK